MSKSKEEIEKIEKDWKDLLEKFLDKIENQIKIYEDNYYKENEISISAERAERIAENSNHPTTYPEGETPNTMAPFKDSQIRKALRGEIASYTVKENDPLIFPNHAEGGKAELTVSPDDKIVALWKAHNDIIKLYNARHNSTEFLDKSPVESLDEFSVKSPRKPLKNFAIYNPEDNGPKPSIGATVRAKGAIKEAAKIMNTLSNATRDIETSNSFKKFINSALDDLKAFAQKLRILSRDQDPTAKKDPLFKTTAFDLSQQGKALLTDFEKRTTKSKEKHGIDLEGPNKGKKRRW